MNIEYKIDELTKFIVEKVGDMQGVVLGLSGGLDSAVCLMLAVKAIGYDCVRTYSLPYTRTSSTTIAGRLAEQMHVNHMTIPISHAVNACADLNTDLSLIRKGNIMARVRMICLYDQAKAHQSIVLGTSNKTERMLGYYTLHGDGAEDIAPLWNVYKTDVYEMAKILKVPEEIIDRPATAELWKDQTDEGDIGMTYAEMDAILKYVYDSQPLSRNTRVTEEQIGTIVSRVRYNDFKEQLPFHPYN